MHPVSLELMTSPSTLLFFQGEDVPFELELIWSSYTDSNVWSLSTHFFPNPNNIHIGSKKKTNK